MCCKEHFEKWKKKTPQKIVDCWVFISSDLSLSALKLSVEDSMAFWQNLLKLLPFLAEKSRVRACLIMG